MTNHIRKSDTFAQRRSRLLERLESGDITEEYFDKLSNIDDMLKDAVEEAEASEDFTQNNLEYDLRSTEWVAEKCQDRVYAQHLYAALCNNEFVKNEPWPLLKEEVWSCSWRHAGAVVANIRERGDYLDWYCSGMSEYAYNESDRPVDLSNLNLEQVKRLQEKQAFVGEGVVTDEIKQDLLTLGWVVYEK